MNYTRRAFLRQAALGLASIGASQTVMAAAAHRYHQVLAKPTGRKLAFLVGIDQYPNAVYGASSSPSRSSSLFGCVTDVRLQQELLIYRFGFQPDDVHLLLNENATRQTIENTFISHLVNQAEPGDVVVFHFSGLGSQVEVVDSTDSSSRVKNSLVPVDGRVPTEDQPFLNDVMVESLYLLVRSLKTEHVVTFLDASYGIPDGWQNGYFRLRSRTTLPKGPIHPDELAFQSQLAQQKPLSKESARGGLFPGLFIRASDASHGAVECQWNGFSAGLFTYALTQQLWWQDAEALLPMKISLAGAKAEQIIGSPYQPLLSGTKSDKLALKNHRFRPLQSMSLDGAVTIQKTESSPARAFLGGLPPLVLNHYGDSSIFRLVSASDAQRGTALSPREIASDSAESTGKSPAVVTLTSSDDSHESPDAVENTSDSLDPSPSVDSSKELPISSSENPQRSHLQTIYVQLRSRSGLYGQIRSVNSQSSTPPITVGQLLIEHIRVISKSIGLNVALDTQLERIERVDATSALSSIEKIASTVAGEEAADVLFGKSLPFISQVSTADSASDTSDSSTGDRSPVSEGYGLFYLSHISVPNTLDRSEEAVKTAVQRLEPKFRSLLAAKLLRLTENQGSSRLGVQATLEMLSPQERILLQQTTSRAPWDPPESRLAQLLVSDGQVPSIPMGSEIRYRIQNYGDRPVYCVIVGIDSTGNIFAVHPSETLGKGIQDASIDDDSMIRPGEMLALPPGNTSAEWNVSGSEGLSETYVICSQKPFTRMTRELIKAMRPMGNFRQMSMLSDATDPTNVVQAMLADLDDVSRSEETSKFSLASDAYAFHMEKCASLSFIFRVE